MEFLEVKTKCRIVLDVDPLPLEANEATTGSEAMPLRRTKKVEQKHGSIFKVWILFLRYMVMSCIFSVRA